jgi:hypothetical protein
MLAEAKRLGVLAKRFLANPELKRLDKQVKDITQRIRDIKTDCDAISDQRLAECDSQKYVNPEGLFRRLIEKHPEVVHGPTFPADFSAMNPADFQRTVSDALGLLLIGTLIPYRAKFLKAKREARCADLGAAESELKAIKARITELQYHESKKPIAEAEAVQ